MNPFLDPPPPDFETLPIRIGKDELNLIEFPIALLSGRAGSEQKTLKFSDTIAGEKGRQVKREWVVAGSEEFGLPTASDEDIFIALLETTKEIGFGSRTVPISRYDIVYRLGMPHNGKSFQRVKEALDRLSSMQIFAKNAFWDRTVRKYTSVSFSIIDSYTLYDETPGRKTEQTKFEHLSSITWSEVMFTSFLAGNLKSLDLNRYFSLQTATARRLFRYLDKRFFDGKPLYEEKLSRLAYERLGMSRTRKYASQIKEKLFQAHEELIGCGFLSRVEYREGQEGEIAVYYPGRKVKTLTTSRTPSPCPPIPTKKPVPEKVNDKTEASPLLRQLLDHGVGKTIAARLVKENPGEVELQLEYFPHVKPSEIRTAPGAYLTDAIKNGYGPPAGYLKVQKAAERTRKITDAREKKAGTAEPTEEAQRVQSIRERLSPEELEAVEREAVESYFKQYPHMRRSLGKKMDDPKQRQKVAGSVIDRMLLERYDPETDAHGS